MTEILKSEPLIEIATGQVVDAIPEAPAILATGPLTDEALVGAIEALPACINCTFSTRPRPLSPWNPSI